MKVAIVGSGVAGLVAAAGLHPAHEIRVFEAGDHAGGHAWTVDVEHEGATWPVDVGFMVYNEVTYPNFVQMLARLGIETRATDMGFSVSDRQSGLEYCGTTLDGVFAQRRNLVRPAFLRMLAEILRFNREAPAAAERGGSAVTLGELLARGGYSRAFRDLYLVPMGAAIWSAGERDMLRFPALFFVRFFRNHGLLEPPHRQLRWRTVRGGAREYVRRLSAPFADRIALRTPVLAVRRVPGGAGVDVVTAAGTGRFDQVVLATPAATALTLLGTPSAPEREVLGAFRARANVALLHTDAGALPRRRRAWASWNYHVPPAGEGPVAVTYDLSRLQGHATRTPILLTLNDTGRVRPEHVVRTIPFEHPLFTVEALAAQARHGEVSGADRVHFCGAYWRNGFHEDGVASGLAVLRAFERAGVHA
jgi:predicted NAD/FAD-binding protein